jgi:histidine triad (HIT) family protein
MDNNCRFCDLAQSRRACQKVYEDDRFLAFLDRCPVNEGHVLVIPKAHVVEFQDAEDETYLSMMTLVKQIGKAIKSCFQPVRVGLLIAGFHVAHTHVHVIPMFSISDVATSRVHNNEWQEASSEALETVADKLRLYLSLPDHDARATGASQ